MEQENSGRNTKIMPTFRQSADAIFASFKTGMGSSRPNVVIAWPNIEFDPNTDFDRSANEAWARISLRTADSTQITVGTTGGRRFRTIGLVLVEVFAPLGLGQDTALAVADDVAASLRGITTSSNVVRLGASSIEPEGREETYYQVNITTPFEFDLTA